MNSIHRIQLSRDKHRHGFFPPSGTSDLVYTPTLDPFLCDGISLSGLTGGALSSRVMSLEDLSLFLDRIIFKISEGTVGSRFLFKTPRSFSFVFLLIKGHHLLDRVIIVLPDRLCLRLDLSL